MVKKVRLLSLLLALSCAGQALAEVRITLKTDKKIVVLGEPLIAQVTVEGVSSPLSSISLDALKQNFDVYGLSGSAQQQKRNGRMVQSETMTLTLYPLRTGKLQLPALRYGGKSSKALAINVLVSDKHAQPVMFKTAVDLPKPLVREVTTLSLEIYDDGSLQWSAPRELVTAGMYQRRLAESQREEIVGGTRYTVHHYSWALMPLREGEQIITFPMLEAFKFGTRLRYPVAPLKLDATAVPAYLPVHVPVGKVQLTAEPLPQEIALQQPVNWVLNIQGTGISEAGVKKLLEAINSNESFKFYHVTVTQTGNEQQDTAKQVLQVTLPFVALRTGMLHLPDINIPYFDPESSRVESVLLAGEQVVVFNPLWRTVRNIFLWLAGLFVLSALSYIVFKKTRRFKARRKALLAIGNAKNADELHAALLKFDLRLKQNATLQQWLQHMQQYYVVDEQLAALVHRLEACKYADVAGCEAIQEMAQSAVSVLSKSSERWYAGNSKLWRLLS